MKKLYITGAVLFISLFSFAQYKDPKAKAILDEVSAKFKSYKTVTANFGYAISNSAGKVLSSKKGTVQMKGNKYSINLGTTKIMSDGVTSWNYDPAAKEVTVNNVSAAEGTITPQKLFTDFYNKDFIYLMENKEAKIAGKPVYKIVMKPVDSNKPFERVYVAVDKSTKNIVSTTVVEKSGNRYVYNVSNFKTNLPIADDNFAFDKAKYPGVEVVDLR